MLLLHGLAETVHRPAGLLQDEPLPLAPDGARRLADRDQEIPRVDAARGAQDRPGQEAAAGGFELAGDPNTIVKKIDGMDTSEFFDSIDEERRNLSLFFQNRIEAHPLILNVGFRWDNNSIYGKAFSPRFSGALTLDKTKTRFKTNWAKGFRAPAFQELYIADPLFGNPDLKPEKSTSFDAGFEQPLLHNLSIVCTYFHIDFEDLIEKDFPSRNIGAAVTKGAEGELTYHPFSKLNLVAYLILFK